MRSLDPRRAAACVMSIAMMLAGCGEALVSAPEERPALATSRFAQLSGCSQDIADHDVFIDENSIVVSGTADEPWQLVDGTGLTDVGNGWSFSTTGVSATFPLSGFRKITGVMIDPFNEDEQRYTIQFQFSPTTTGAFDDSRSITTTSTVGFGDYLFSAPVGARRAKMTILGRTVFDGSPSNGINDIIFCTSTLSAPSINAVGTVPPRGSVKLGASGGEPPYTFSADTLNSGSGAGVSNGVYTAGVDAGTVDTVRVTDAFGQTATRSITVGPGVSLNVGATATYAPAESFDFNASGGSGTGFTFALLVNGSPAASNPATGSTVNASTGLYKAGTMSAANETLRVTDSLGNTDEVVLTIGPGVSISPGSATIAPNGERPFTASGGKGGYTWSMLANPSGGSVDAISGRYRAGGVGETQDVLVATDSLGNKKSVQIVVTASLGITPRALRVLRAEAHTFQASGGSGAGYTWSLTRNSSNGSINTATGEYVAGTTPGLDEVTLTDSNGNVAHADVAVEVPLLAPPLMLSTFPATASCGVPYLYSDGETPKVDGSGPFLFELKGKDKALPSGLDIDPYSGAIDWVPSTAGDYAFDLVIRGVAGAQTVSATVKVTCGSGAPQAPPPSSSCNGLPGTGLFWLVGVAARRLLTQRSQRRAE